MSKSSVAVSDKRTAGKILVGFGWPSSVLIICFALQTEPKFGNFAPSK